MTLVLIIAQPPDRECAVSTLSTQLRELRTRSNLRIDALDGSTDGARAQLAAVIDRFEQAADRHEAVALLSSALIVSDGALLRVLDDPALGVGALVAAHAGAHGVSTQGAVVLSAATALHPIPDADADTLGLVYISGAELPHAIQALRATLAAADAAWDVVDIPDLVVAVLSRAGSMPPLSAVRLEPDAGARVADAAEAAAAASRVAEASVDDADLAARTAARPADGFYSTFVLRRISARLTPWAIRRGIAANTVTSVSAVIGVAAAVAFAFGTYPSLILGAVLLQLSILLDCVDGEIARATRTGSAFGGWLDAATDRLKEYGALAGLALAGHHLWTIAAAGMLVQTVRHIQDFSFDKGVLAEWRASFRDMRPMSDLSPWQRPAGCLAGPEPLTGSPGMWARRLIRMPIGERWLVLCVAALADRPAAGLYAYLALTLLAEAWTILGAVRRSVVEISLSSHQIRARLADYRDDGLLDIISAGHSPHGRFAWVLPPLVTAAEGAAVIALTAAYAPQWRAAAFGWFALVAWHRYDIVYRRTGPTPSVPATIGRLGGGWLLRGAAVLIAAGAGCLPAVLIAGSIWFAVIYLPHSVFTGMSAGKTTVRRPA